MTTPPAPAPGPLDGQPVAALLAVLAGVADAGIALAAAFDWIDLDGPEAAAIMAFVAAVTAAVGAVLRSIVWSPRTVRALTTATDPELAP